MTSAYLGPAGNLVEFACPSDEQPSLGDRVKLKLTVDGTQQAQYSRKSPRAWQVGIGTATPDQVAQLNALAHGLYGPPPWVYVGPWAQVTNLLSPKVSVCSPETLRGNVVPGGTVALDDSTRPMQSVLSGAGAVISFAEAPCIPGVPVTASVWAAGQSGFSIELNFLDAAFGFLSLKREAYAAPVGRPLVRGSVTATPPVGAAYAYIRVPDAQRAALPAITWTPDLAAWAVGGGAEKVVHRGLSEAVQLAVRDDRNLRRSSLSFTLEEVGNA